MLELGAMSLELRRLAPAFAAVAALAGLAGCPIVNENHCAYLMQGGAADPCPADFVCNRCTASNNGCISVNDVGDVPNDCFEGLATAGSSGATVTDSTTSPTTTPTSTTTPGTSLETTETTVPATATETGSSSATDSDGTSTTGTMTATSSTTGEAKCDPGQEIADPDCNAPGEPYCVGLGVCGPCGDLAGIGKSCSDIDPAKTVCDAMSGLCAECTKDDTSACPDNLPGCSYDGQCAKCTEHRECPETACDIEEGLCFPTDSVIYVKNDLAACTGGNGTMAKPYCNFQVALPMIMPGKKTTIKVIPGGMSTMFPLALVEAGYILAVLSSDKQIPTLDGKGNADSMIEVSTNSRVYVSKLRFQFSGSPSVLQCTGGILYLDDVKIEGDGINPARALDLQNCKTVIQRSRIFKNTAGIQVTGGSLSLENTHIARNGTANAAFGAFNLLSGATVQMNYSSVALQQQTKSTSVFKCAAGIGQILIRNSAVLGLNPMQSAECAASIKQEMGVILQVNTVDEQTALADMWFDGLVDGALPADPVGPLKDMAMWELGDPRFDHDGVARPLDAPSFAGADEPPM